MGKLFLTAFAFLGLFFVSVYFAYEFSEAYEVVGQFSEDYKEVALWKFKNFMAILLSVVFGVLSLCMFFAAFVVTFDE